LFKVFSLLTIIMNFDALAFELKSQAKSICMVDTDSGKVLFEKNAHGLIYPASTTKIATAAFALTKLKEEDLANLLEANLEALASMSKLQKRKLNYLCKPFLLEPDGTSLKIKNQEKLPIKALLFGLMMASANDAANVLAFHLGNKGIDSFVKEMNTWLKSLGCQKTHFMNPHGLHHPLHVTTAYEMTLIAKEAMQHPFFRELVTTQTSIRPRTNKSEAIPFAQHNRLMKEGDFYYPYAKGIKTGYTEDAGYCLVAAADNGKRSLIAAVMGSPVAALRYADVIELFNQAFDEEILEQKIYDKSDTRFTLDNKESSKKIEAIFQEDVTVSFYPSNKPFISTQVVFDKVLLPLEKHQKIGELTVLVDGKKSRVYPLVAKDSYQQKGYLRALLFLKTHFIALSFGFFFLNAFLYLLIKNFKKFFCFFTAQGFSSLR
jgi:D-alanyl-D-alanine carboxypeptidase (penicillin-binding protein 5/6)